MSGGYPFRRLTPVRINWKEATVNDEVQEAKPADPEWDAERERMERFIADSFYSRADAQGDWFNAKGRLNARGSAAAVEYMVGMAQAMQMIDHPRKQWVLNQTWLVSVRGFEDRFPRVPA